MARRERPESAGRMLMRRPDDIRDNLGRAVLLIRGGQVTSRRGLAAALNLSPTTAGDYVDRLIDAGVVRETGVERAGPGRPTRAVAVCAAAGWFAGVEFHAERVRAVRLDFAGQVTGGVVRPLPAGVTAAHVLREIARALTLLRRGAGGPLLAVGVGAAGVVDPQRGVGVDYAFLPDWRDVPVVAWLTRRAGVPVTLENNLRAIAYAERWLGGGRTLNDYVILGPRSGFGIAIVIGSRVLSGSHAAAGEIGSWPQDGGSLHDTLAAPAVWRRLSGASPRMRPPADLGRGLVSAAARQPRRLGRITADYAEVLARLQLLLDTQAYFLHGPLTALGLVWCEEICRRAVRLAPALGSRPPVMLPSSLGDEAGAIGAACHAMERWVPAVPAR
jgi:predicted NBD/HSP70 family sugar kinase